MLGKGVAAEGGAIYSSGTVTLSGVTVKSNFALGHRHHGHRRDRHQRIRRRLVCGSRRRDFKERYLQPELR